MTRLDLHLWDNSFTTPPRQLDVEPRIAMDKTHHRIGVKWRLMPPELRARMRRFHGADNQRYLEFRPKQKGEA
jgi:hypothetical protein